MILDALAFRIGHKEVLEEVEEWLQKQRSKETEVYMPPSLEDWNLIVPPIRTIDLTDLTEVTDIPDIPDTLNSEESVKDSETTEEITCTGCIEDQPNQLAHMHFGGCLYDY
jgi:hypothetical protein